MNTELADFGAGCFWGVEAAFRRVPGVLDVAAGYEGGSTRNPTYHDVCTDETGHAEVVQVRFDPARVTYAQLLEVFFEGHDPTTIDRQGPDIGKQYRSVVFYHSQSQREQAEAEILRRNNSGQYVGPIVTAVEPADTFYRAEEYHQRYFEKKGVNYTCHIGNGKKR